MTGVQTCALPIYGAAFIFLLLVMGIALTSIFLRIRMRNRYRW